ncbi:MAG: ribosomal-processing cysteine protease Prp [Clostridiales bacterium]|nr:ribosomal-processing cysteine protease Prp [Clostridiales bacterium]
MIRIRIKGDLNQIEEFMIWGHARYVQRREDIVCAGVSAISTAAIIGLTELIPGSLQYKILPEGLMHCRLRDGLPEADAQRAQAVLSTMALGLISVWTRYPDHIDFAIRR